MHKTKLSRIPDNNLENIPSNFYSNWFDNISDIFEIDFKNLISKKKRFLNFHFFCYYLNAEKSFKLIVF